MDLDKDILTVGAALTLKVIERKDNVVIYRVYVGRWWLGRLFAWPGSPNVRFFGEDDNHNGFQGNTTEDYPSFEHFCKEMDGSDIDDLVIEAIENAEVNGYTFDTWSDEDLGNDMVECGGIDRDPQVVIAAVKRFRENR